MRISAVSQKGGLAEMIEIPDHPFFVACQFHPEFNSKPNDTPPTFAGFIAASLAHQGAA